MRTKLLRTSTPGAIEEAAAVLRAGGLVAFPTDTVYGLGAHLDLPRAVERIFAVKGRAAEKAIPVLLARAEHLESVAQSIPAVAWELAEAFWPGGLTLVLPRLPRVPDVVVGGGPTVAVRVPNHPIALRLIEETGAPLATTSANRSGRTSPKTAGEVRRELDGLIDIILDGGRVPGGLESTVLDLTSTPPAVLRRGAIPPERLARFLNH
ncbi:MAG: threonylcarbamoyl-AMP synthase [Chloroflexi bacterium]|nr:threonylcarbamoyl-AMP synthase [Chloroflexota bacterium]